MLLDPHAFPVDGYMNATGLHAMGGRARNSLLSELGPWAVLILTHDIWLAHGSRFGTLDLPFGRSPKSMDHSVRRRHKLKRCERTSCEIWGWIQKSFMRDCCRGLVFLHWVPSAYDSSVAISAGGVKIDKAPTH